MPKLPGSRFLNNCAVEFVQTEAEGAIAPAEFWLPLRTAPSFHRRKCVGAAESRIVEKNMQLKKGAARQGRARGGVRFCDWLVIRSGCGQALLYYYIIYYYYTDCLRWRCDPLYCTRRLRIVLGYAAQHTSFIRHCDFSFTVTNIRPGKTLTTICTV